MGEKHEAAEKRWLAGAAYAPIAEQKKRWGARTQGLSLLRQALGSEDVPGLLEQAGGGAAPGEPTTVGGTTGLEMTPLGYDKLTATFGGGGIGAYGPAEQDPLFKEEALRVDPLKLVRGQAETSQFKIARRGLQLGEGMLMTPEERARKVNEGHEGAILAESFESTLKAGIVESTGAAARENSKQISEAMRRGGAARRTALDGLARINAQARVMGERMQALTNADLAFKTYGQQVAREAVNFADAWAGSVPGLDIATNQAMDAIGQMFLSSSLPTIVGQRAQGAAIRAQMHQENRNKASQIYAGAGAIAALIAAPFTGGATLGIAAGLGAQALSPGAAGPSQEQWAQGATGVGGAVQDWWQGRGGGGTTGTGIMSGGFVG